METCPACGYDYLILERSEIPQAIRVGASNFADAFASIPADAVRIRPADEVWAPIEYACHLRDVLRVQRERVWLAVVEQEPEFALMRRDERAIEEDYAGQDPDVVRVELLQAGDDLADWLDALDGEGWDRTAVYHYPERQTRTVEWIGRHTVHECVHHLADITTR